MFDLDRDVLQSLLLGLGISFILFQFGILGLIFTFAIVYLSVRFKWNLKDWLQNL